MIELKLLNAVQLETYLDSDEFREAENLAISRQRGWSQLQNPLLEPDDVLLLLAYLEGEMVGYLGVMPTQINYRGHLEKYGCLTCLWVSPKARGQGLATRLFRKAFDSWEHKLYAADYVPQTKVIYDRTECFVKESYQQAGLRLYFRADFANILPPKKKIFAQTKTLWKLFDGLFNGIFDLRFVFYPKTLPDLELEYVDQLDPELVAFIEDKQSHLLFPKSGAQLNWILKYPWVLSAPMADRNNQRYYFSSLDRSFDFSAIKIRNAAGKLIAFLILSKRNDTLKLPFLYHDGNLEAVAQVIQLHLIQWKIKTFTTFQKDLAAHLAQRKTPALYKKEIRRNYMISKAYEAAFFDTDKDFQDGDGDVAFT